MKSTWELDREFVTHTKLLGIWIQDNLGLIHMWFTTWHFSVREYFLWKDVWLGTCFKPFSQSLL